MNNSHKKYKVLILLTGREKGGISNVISYLTSGLRQSRFEIIILIMSNKEVTFLRDSKIVQIPRSHVLDVGHFFRIKKCIEKNNIDIIHSHSIISNIYAFLIRFFCQHVRHIIHVHANLSLELSSSAKNYVKREFLLRANKIALNRCDKIISNSVQTKNFLKNIGINSRKIRVVYNGIDREMIKARASEIPDKNVALKGTIVGTVGRLMPIKNYSFFLHVAKEVLNDDHKIEFLIIGNGIERNKLENLASSLGILENVIFAGWVENPYPLIAKMDIFVLTSLWEGLGIVLMEAMALGKPVIATKVGGIPEVVEDGKSGILIPPDDVESFSKAISTLLKKPEMREKMGERGTEIVKKKFAFEEMIDSIEKEYMSLVY